jgi:hypothetical protein
MSTLARVKASVRLTKSNSLLDQISRSSASLLNPDSRLAADVRDSRVADRLGELAHYYNVGVWTLLGFLLCFLMAAVLGVESVMAAFALGFKVMVFLFFAQAALLTYCMTQGCKLI